MKLLTATLITETRTVPSGVSASGVGLRCKITNVATSATSTTPTQTSPIFTIGPFVEGSKYRYAFQSVDAVGTVIQEYPVFESETPGGATMTYQHITGVNFVWEDA